MSSLDRPRGKFDKNLSALSSSISMSPSVSSTNSPMPNRPKISSTSSISYSSSSLLTPLIEFDCSVKSDDTTGITTAEGAIIFLFTVAVVVDLSRDVYLRTPLLSFFLKILPANIQNQLYRDPAPAHSVDSTEQISVSTGEVLLVIIALIPPTR